MKMIFKIDMICQEKKASEQTNTQMLLEMMKMMTGMIEKFEHFEEKMKKIESSAIVSHSNNVRATVSAAASSSSSSYSSAVQTGVPMSAVVVKPKQKQHSNKTMEQIVNTVDTASVNVCSTRNARDGGISLC